MLALTIKTRKKEFAPKPVTLKSFLLPFKKIKNSNAKVLYSLFLFKNKVLKAKREDFKFNRSTFLKNVFITGSLQKCKAKKN